MYGTLISHKIHIQKTRKQHHNQNSNLQKHTTTNMNTSGKPVSEHQRALHAHKETTIKAYNTTSS